MRDGDAGVPFGRARCSSLAQPRSSATPGRPGPLRGVCGGSPDAKCPAESTSPNSTRGTGAFYALASGFSRDDRNDPTALCEACAQDHEQSGQPPEQQKRQRLLYQVRLRTSLRRRFFPCSRVSHAAQHEIRRTDSRRRCARFAARTWKVPFCIFGDWVRYFRTQVRSQYG